MEKVFESKNKFSVIFDKLNKTRITNVNILLASVTATFLFSMYAASAVYMGTSTSSSTTNSNQANVEYPEGNQQFVSISSTEKVNLFIDTTSTGTIAYGQGNVTIASNAAGYSLYVSTSSDDPDMHLDGDPTSSDVLPSTTSSNTILKDIDTNSWAISIGEKDENFVDGHPETYLYNSIPVLSSPKYISFSTNSLANYTLYYGAKADKTAKEGTYSQTIVYTLIAWGETVKDLGYTGGEQTFIVPADGYYKLETWGAQGGTFRSNNNVRTYYGGLGAYSVGNVYLRKNTPLYVNVGGRGEDNDWVSKGTKSIGGLGGYNGGGQGGHGSDQSGYYYPGSGGGGGATHIATVSGQLYQLESYKGSINAAGSTYDSNTILIVSGGGGGGSEEVDGASEAGSGGGYTGNGVSSSYVCRNMLRRQSGPTQFDGYAFGLGGNGGPNSDACAADGHGGGGGGWYGGYALTWTGMDSDAPGVGGSGYIGSSRLVSNLGVTKHMTGYKMTNVNTTDESIYTISTNNYSETPTVDYAKAGNGHARITYIGN